MFVTREIKSVFWLITEPFSNSSNPETLIFSSALAIFGVVKSAQSCYSGEN